MIDIMQDLRKTNCIQNQQMIGMDNNPYQFPCSKLKPVMEKVNIKWEPIQQWTPEPGDIVFNQSKGFIIGPIAQYFNIVDEEKVKAINYFAISPKRAYNDSKIRGAITHYLNYFEKFYDRDRELLEIYAKLKMLIDCEPSYSEKNLFDDMNNLILSGPIYQKLYQLNHDNYCLDIKFNGRYENLKYTNEHVYCMMLMSTMINICVPLLTHFAKVRMILQIDPFLRKFFDIIIHKFEGFDYEAKLYESCISNVNAHKHDNPIWKKQDIRCISPTTHAIDSVNNIILNVMIKYRYSPDANPVMLNHAAIKFIIGCKVQNIGYELDYVPVSSSNRDEDNNSELDKYESYLIKLDESLYIQNNVNADHTMKQLEQKYGPISIEEINYYRYYLAKDGKDPINEFQQEIVNYTFFKYFGDTVSVNVISEDDYIKLMIIAKRILMKSGLLFLSYVVSSRVDRLYKRKKLNAKEDSRIEGSQTFNSLRDRYYNFEKIGSLLKEIAATILSSKFTIIDYDDPTVDQKLLVPIPEYITEEVSRWAKYFVC